jgi:hypothetical protein
MYMAEKVRTQLYLTREQRRVLRELARSTGKSSGELVREALEEVYLKRRVSPAPLAASDSIWELVGKAEPAESDISERHDDYLYNRDQ